MDLEPLSFSQPEVQRDPLPFVRKLLAGPRVYVDPLTGIPMVTRHADIAYVYAHPKVSILRRTVSSATWSTAYSRRARSANSRRASRRSR